MERDRQQPYRRQDDSSVDNRRPYRTPEERRAQRADAGQATRPIRTAPKRRSVRDSQRARTVRATDGSRDVRVSRDAHTNRQTARQADPRVRSRQTTEDRSRASRPERKDSPTVAPMSASAGLKRISLGIVSVLMVLGCVIGLAFFYRPSVSALENRELTPFPTFSIESVLNGDYFSDLATWYSDTYPLREQLVSASNSFSSLFGIQPEQQVVGSEQVADEVPDTEESSASNLETREAVEVPTEESMAEDIQDNIMGRLYVENGAAYSVYYFSKESVQQYAAAISMAADRLDGFSTVYSIIVPNNSAVMLSEQTLSDLGGTNQSKAIDYFYSLYDPRVNTVKVLDALRSQNSTYEYFRTDHHWTADGAYVAYVQFCERKGIEPVDKTTLETTQFDPFLGSYYTQLELSAMEENPDYVKVYYPSGTNTLLYWDKDGNGCESKVIQDVTGWNSNSLYNTFICGDQPLAHIYNPELDDDSSVLLVKDSFGCAFAPWLVANYQNVWIIDFRYTSENIVDFAKEHEIQDVIFLNNIEIAGTTSVANMLTNEVSESSSEG